MQNNQPDQTKGGVQSVPTLSSSQALRKLVANRMSLLQAQAHEHFVKARQASNDAAIDFVSQLIAAHDKAKQSELLNQKIYYIGGGEEAVPVSAITRVYGGETKT